MLSFCKDSLVNPYKNNVAKGFDLYKGESPFVIKNIITKYTWSPIVFKNEYRQESNFISAEYIALDFDEGITIDEIANRYSDTWHIIGTTRSHQKQKKDKAPCDRFRLLLKATRETHDLREYKHTMRYYIDNHRADKACKDGARYFFPCVDIVSEFYGEDCYYEEWKTPPTIEEEKETMERMNAQRVYRIENGIMPWFSRMCLTREIPQGERSIACWKMGRELAMCGLSYEDALMRVLASPTYKDSVIDSKTMSKIKSQVRAGYEQIKKTRGA